MSQSGRFTPDVPSGRFLETINGDVGSVSGQTVTFSAVLTAGSTVSFDGSGTLMTLNTTDTLSNTIIGVLAGNATLTGSFNTGLGKGVFDSLTSGQNNVGVGYASLLVLTNGNSNTAIGYESLTQNNGSDNTAVGIIALGGNPTGVRNCALGSGALVSCRGNRNIGIGYSAGGSFANGDNNIYIGTIAPPTTTESDATRIGNTGLTATCYILGIGGVDVASTANVVVEDGDQLGTAVLTAGTGISITAGPNSITIEATGGGGGVGTIDGDSGSATGSTITFNAATNSGSTVEFTASGSTVDLHVTDLNDNTIVGFQAGNNAISGINNTGLGSESLMGLTSGSNNVAVGYEAGKTITSGSNNIYLGNIDGAAITESNTTRIGHPGDTNDCFILGIGGVNVGSTANVVVEDSDQLGTAVLVAGSGISITTGANSITIAATGGGGGIATLDGDSGSATGSTVTLTGSTTGLTFTGASSTVTLGGDLIVANGGTGRATLTNHGVLVGAGTTAITQLAVGSTNTVLLGNTGADPSFGTVPNAALTNSSVTLNNGNNITVTGSPLSLGGVASFNLTGTTNHSVQIGNAGGSLTSVAVGTTGQVLTGVTGADPVFASPAASSISITGNSGGALTGNSFTFTGGTTGLTFAGGGTTETLGGDLVVANGGTGNTTFTAYSVICGGTTSTGAFQNVSGLGTSGQVLTSNGVSALPTWQPGGGGGGGITTINGDTGSVTGSTVTFAGSSGGTSYAGSSVEFISLLDGVTMVLNVTDNNDNTFVGKGSGNTTGSGTENSGFGSAVLSTLTSGNNNTALGTIALTSLSSGDNNVCVGFEAGFLLDTGSSNICIGYQSGMSYTTSESSNILIGDSVVGIASESNVLRIGNGTGTGQGQLDSAFISGIQGITVTGSAVLVDSSDQLGVAISSRRYKENIKDMDDISSDIFKLRPVSFNYIVGNDQSLQTGLIAEEVEEIMPSLCTYDKDGLIQSVKYHDLPALLLNEIQKLRKEVDYLKTRIKE